MKTKQEGDATWCKTCEAFTVYKDVCAVCETQSEENRKKYKGDLNYLKAKYPGY